MKWRGIFYFFLKNKESDWVVALVDLIGWSERNGMLLVGLEDFFVHSQIVRCMLVVLGADIAFYKSIFHLPDIEAWDTLLNCCLLHVQMKSLVP